VQLLDTLDVPSSGDHRIELLVGDLSAIPVEHAVDIDTSAAPNDASQTGISVSAEDSPEMKKFLNLLIDGKEIRLDVRVRVVNDKA